jgi:hypothetical protein
MSCCKRSAARGALLKLAAIVPLIRHCMMHTAAHAAMRCAAVGVVCVLTPDNAVVDVDELCCCTSIMLV